MMTGNLVDGVPYPVAGLAPNREPYSVVLAGERGHAVLVSDVLVGFVDQQRDDDGRTRWTWAAHPATSTGATGAERERGHALNRVLDAAHRPGSWFGPAEHRGRRA